MPWLSKPRSLPIVGWIANSWNDLRFYWYTSDRGHLFFFLALCVPISLFGYVLYSAGNDLQRIELERARSQDLTCLARNLYFEARGEPSAGQYAVAEVTLNRVASGHFPNTVCEVVHEERWDAIRKRYVGAFSWTEMRSTSTLEDAAWKRAVIVATEVYDDQHVPRVPAALFYHERNIRPSWARAKKPIATIGRHIFYQ